MNLRQGKGCANLPARRGVHQVEMTAHQFGKCGLVAAGGPGVKLFGVNFVSLVDPRRRVFRTENLHSA
jgi:hypothetical protein